MIKTFCPRGHVLFTTDTKCLWCKNKKQALVKCYLSKKELDATCLSLWVALETTPEEKVLASAFKKLSKE